MLRRLHPVLVSIAAALLLALPLAAQQQNSGSAQQPSTARQTNTKQTKKKKDSPKTPPAAPAPQPGTSTADQNPFPEAQSEKAAREAKQQQNPGQTNQDSSSSAIPGLKLPTKPSKPPAPALNPSLGRQDTRVGDFYLQSGDWKGAYSRFLEATQVDPGDSEAVYGLAAAARHLGYRKVAIQNLQLYLAALPNGPRAKDARKALKDMGAQP